MPNTTIRYSPKYQTGSSYLVEIDNDAPDFDNPVSVKVEENRQIKPLSPESAMEEFKKFRELDRAASELANEILATSPKEAFVFEYVDFSLIPNSEVMYDANGKAIGMKIYQPPSLTINDGKITADFSHVEDPALRESLNKKVSESSVNKG